MELRNHPRMMWQGHPNWPPEWIGSHGPNRPLPQGEVGVLLRVVPRESLVPYCVFERNWNDQEYVGSLLFDDQEFLETTYDVLRSHVGCLISEVGSLDIP
jgi:hypothetical protein